MRRERNTLVPTVATDGRMEILDEHGRLFGRVNVVDALVVVFALAVLIAGGALVLGDDPDTVPGPDEPPEATMYVTLYSGGDVATTFTAGNVTLDGANATVTDIHRTVGPRTYLRVALVGEETDEGFRFDGDPVRLGDGFTVVDDEARTGMRVVERDVGPEFETATTTVTVEEIVRPSLADAVSAGDEQRVGGSAVATVADVETSTINETHSDLQVTLELETRVVDDVPHYGDRPVRIGRTLVVATDDYEFRAEVTSRETDGGGG